MHKILQTPRAVFLLLMMSFVGCGGQPEVPQIDGVKGPFFNIMDGKILISLTLEQVEISGGARIPINDLNNSYLEVSPALEGGTLFQVGLDPADLEGHDWSLVDPQSLPGGRPLPGISGGQLPSIAVHVPELEDTTFYVSKKVFGFFIPMRVSTQAIVTFRLQMDGGHLGNLSVVGQDPKGDNDGLLLLMNLNAQGKEKVKQLLRQSEKAQNRHKLY